MDRLVLNGHHELLGNTVTPASVTQYVEWIYN